MSDAILVPMIVFGLGFIISFFMAVIIKVILVVIRKASKEK